MRINKLMFFCLDKHELAVLEQGKLHPGGALTMREKYRTLDMSIFLVEALLLFGSEIIVRLGYW